MGIVRGEPGTSTVVADVLAHMATPPRIAAKLGSGYFLITTIQSFLEETASVFYDSQFNAASYSPANYEDEPTQESL